MTRVEVVHWNPRRRVSRLLPGRVTRPVNNFGDLLGPWIVDRILRRHNLSPQPAVASRTPRLVAVGSIMHLAADGDVVWGAGVNGKARYLDDGVKDLDVRAVRGPLTHEFLADAGVSAPKVFGDPGALVGQLWEAGDIRPSARRRPITVIPNLNDSALRAHPGAVDPRSPLSEILETIAVSDFVCGSSLHAIVVAESFGIPARVIRAASEPEFKYADYYRGTGRSAHHPASTVGEAIDLGGEPPARLDPALLAAFPLDLWVEPDAG